MSCVSRKVIHILRDAQSHIYCYKMSKRMKLVLLLALLVRRRKILQKRRWWVRPIQELRAGNGEFDGALQIMRNRDPDYFCSYYRMMPSLFDHLLSLVKHELLKKSPRDPVSPEERLAITLRYLASGMEQKDVALSFRRGKSTVHNVLKETCKAIWKVLSDKYVKFPTSFDEWTLISKEFWE